MKPIDLACRPQVADVIGEAYADHELQRVIDCEECGINEKRESLIDSFPWDDSPQKDDFWGLIHIGRNPYEHGHEKPELKEWVYHRGEWLCRDNDYYTDENGCCTIHISEVNGAQVHIGEDKPEEQPNQKLKDAFKKAEARGFDKQRSDGSTASYYELPEGATELQHLISHRNQNGQIAEIFRACYRYGLVSHSDMLRDAKKIKFYAQAEIERLEKLAQSDK